jgi:hypothetical protein
VVVAAVVSTAEIKAEGALRGVRLSTAKRIPRKELVARRLFVTKRENRSAYENIRRC